MAYLLCFAKFKFFSASTVTMTCCAVGLVLPLSRINWSDFSNLVWSETHKRHFQTEALKHTYCLKTNVISDSFSSPSVWGLFNHFTVFLSLWPTAQWISICSLIFPSQPSSGSQRELLKYFVPDHPHAPTVSPKLDTEVQFNWYIY